MNRSEPIASRRRAGRPSRLSRELIISTTLEMLGEIGLEQFSVAKLGKRLGASPMSLYTYFPSRDALLDATAEQAFLLFEMPERSGRWQDFVLAWLRSVALHFERFPVALQVIAWDEHVSVGWLHVLLPLLRVFAEDEPDAERRAMIQAWFTTASIGLIHAHINGPKRVGDFPDDALDPFPPEDRELLRQVYRGGSPATNWKLEFGFRNIIAGLEALFASSGRAGDEFLIRQDPLPKG
jgi:AcrR family transcriptional regulator